MVDLPLFCIELDEKDDKKREAYTKVDLKKIEDKDAYLL